MIMSFATALCLKKPADDSNRAFLLGARFVYSFFLKFFLCACQNVFFSKNIDNDIERRTEAFLSLKSSYARSF